MNKKNRSIIKKFSLLLSLILLLTITIQPTFAYYVTKTDSVKNTFRPLQQIAYDLLLTKTVEHPFGETYVIPQGIGFWYQVDLGESYANQELTIVKGTQEAETVSTDETGVVTIWMNPGVATYIQGIAEGTVATVTELNDGEYAKAGFAVKDNISSKEVTITADGAAVEFVNVYTPMPVQNPKISVIGEKLLDGRDWQVGDTFTFILEEQNEQGQWITVAEDTVTYDVNDDMFNMFDFTEGLQFYGFDEVGTYHFRISEKEGNAEYMTYDDALKEFTVTVGDPDMDGYLEIQNVEDYYETVVTKDQKTGSYKVSVTFTNKYIDTSVAPSPEESPKTGDVSPESVGVIVAIGLVTAMMLAATGKRRKYTK